MVNELSVIEQNGKFVVDSREVALMIGKQHPHLLRDIDGYVEILGESNFGSTDFFIKSTYISGQNKILPCYLLTKKGCDMVANKMTGEKGILFTATYVTKFEEMEDKFKQVDSNPFNLPLNYNDALRHLLASTEANERLQQEVYTLKPKADKFDDFLKADNAQTMNEVAKTLDIGRNTLMKFLRIKKIFMGNNMPYSKYCGRSLFRTREFTIRRRNGSTVNCCQTFVMPKGLDWISDIIKDDIGYLLYKENSGQVKLIV